jgi:hypothetical protein
MNNNFVEQYPQMMVHHQGPPPMDSNYNPMPMVSIPVQQPPPNLPQLSPQPPQQVLNEIEVMNANQAVSPIMTPVPISGELLKCFKYLDI